MATEIVMPRLSDTMDSGTIARWLKKEGEAIKRGEILAEIETDKANMDLEAFTDGVLARILVQEGQSVALGDPIAIMAGSAEEAGQIKSSGPASAGEQPQKTPPAEPKQPQEAPPAEPQQSQEAPAAQPSEPNGREVSSGSQERLANLPKDDTPIHASASDGRVAPAAEPHGPSGNGHRIKASPLARRMAQEHDINLADISATGPEGRITKEDVQAYLRSGPAVMPLPAAPAAPSQAAAIARSGDQQAAASGRAPQRIEMSRMQGTIARRMAESRFSAPEFVLVSEVDMTQARAMLKSIAGAEGAPKIGPNDFLVKAVATALSQHRDVNAGWENGAIFEYGRINVGFAVALPKGLVVPVIHDADQKTLGQIAAQAKELIERARSGKLAPIEYENGTFSISNLGMYGIDQFTPIINSPEACILGVGAIAPKPVVVEGDIVVRDRMRMTLSCDHRVVYGAEGAEFLRTLRRLLENPMLVVI